MPSRRSPDPEPTLSIFPHQVHIGDRFTDADVDGTAEWEVVSRPVTFKKGHEVRARVQRPWESCGAWPSSSASWRRRGRRCRGGCRRRDGMSFWPTVLATVVETSVVLVGAWAIRWLRERYQHDFDMREVKGDFSTPLIWWDLRKRIEVPAGISEIRLELRARENCVLKRINVRFVKNKFRQHLVDDDRVNSKD